MRSLSAGRCAGVLIWGIAVVLAGAAPAVAAECPDAGAETATARPAVRNASLVVPTGSLRAENGINLVGRGGSRAVDGTNARLRLGIAACLEILFDAPTYFGRLRGARGSGFSDAAPAVKRQLEGLPEGFSLSATAGLGLPTGDRRIAGRGYGPYLQFPWAQALAGGWRLSGMFTGTVRPSEPADKLVQATFVIEREIGPHADLFVEYVGDYPNVGRASHLINAGGAYRVTRTQQVDFHLGGGLNHAAPGYFFGLGYSIRFDGLF